ncbi:MAG: TrbC/VirB2 family protein [Gammaproteobacteria bacterium]
MTRTIKCLMLLTLLNPIMAHAASGYSSSGFILIDVLQDLIDLITTQIGGLVFVLAMSGVGYFWLKQGRIEKSTAVTSLVAMSMIYGSSWLAQYFGFSS